jgi:hypothetical protein
LVVALQNSFARLWEVFLWKIPRYSRGIVRYRISGRKTVKSRGMKFLVYIAFSVAKLFGQAAKNFPLENMQVFLWNTRHRLYVIKTDA